jgi:hypothetical protein
VIDQKSINRQQNHQADVGDDLKGSSLETFVYTVVQDPKKEK